MNRYWVSMRRHTPLREYSEYVFSGFVESDKETAEEVEQVILHHHQKKGIKGVKVTVIEVKEESKKE